MSEAERAEDRILLTRLKQAVENGDLDIKFKAGTLAGPASPLFRWGDAVLVAGVALVLAILPLYVEGVGWTPPVLVGWAILLVFWIRWYLRRLKLRALTEGLTDLDVWDRIWRLKGAEIRTVQGITEHCTGPEQDWRAFVRKHVLNQL